MKKYRVVMVDGGRVIVRGTGWRSEEDGSLVIISDDSITHSHCFARGQWKYIEEIKT